MYKNIIAIICKSRFCIKFNLGLEMKLTCILLVVALFQARANSFAQVVTLHTSNQSAEYIFNQIRIQTDYDLLCSVELMNSIKPSSLNVEKMPLKKVLDLFLRNQPVTFSINDKNKTVVIKKKVPPLTPITELQTQERDITITGKVTDVNGNGIPGVSVKVKGTTSATSTNNDGSYLLTVPDNNSVLVFSYLGFKLQEVIVNGRKVIDIKLEEEEKGLNEVVIVGYGAQKKVNLIGSVAAVKFDEKITNRALPNVSSALTALMPGLAVNQNSGMAGNNSATLLIRGMGTVNNANPLIVVDGLPDVDINRINMTDIESISVLKDASAAAVYGSRASNGVILVTTKSGKGQTTPTIRASSSVSLEKPTKAIEFLADYPRALSIFQRAAAYNTQPINQTFQNGTIDQWLALGMIDPLRYPNTDWFDVIIRDGTIQNHNISASGGSERSNYFISAGIMDQKGLQINNDFTRYNFRVNYDAKLGKKINIGTRFSGNWSKYLYAYDDGFTASGNVDLQYAIAGVLPYDPATGYYGGIMAYGEDINAFNPYTVFTNQLNRQTRQQATGNAYLDWTPLPGLTAKIDYALNFNTQFQYKADIPNQAYNFQTGQFGTRNYVLPNAGISNTQQTNYKTQFSGSLKYEKNLNKNHYFSALAVYSEEYWNSREMSASRGDRLYQSLHELDAALTTTQTTGGSSYEEGLRSVIGRVNYTAFDKYLFEASARYDGSSKFLPGHQYSFFPSAAFKWRFSEEKFLKTFLSGWLSQGGFRVSYGSLGNNGGVGRYEQQETLASKNYLIQDAITKGFVYTRMVNQELSWENTTVLNFGLDLAFFKNRLTTELDYYDRLTTDMLRPSELSNLLTGAYTPAPRRNIGTLRNRGIEGNFTWKDKAGQFDYSINLNASYNASLLEQWNEQLNRGTVFINMPYHFIYSYEDMGIAQTWQDVYNAAPQSGLPGNILKKDLNGDGRIDGNDMKAYPYAQSDRPTANFGMNGYVAWKGFDLGVLVQATAGRKGFWTNNYNKTSNFQTARYAWTEDHLTKPWSIDNRYGGWPQLTASGNQDNQTFWLDDMSYLRLKNVQIGYSFPKRWIKKVGLDNLRFYMSGENLATYTKYRGIDPEKSNSDIEAYPIDKSYSFGLNIGF